MIIKYLLFTIAILTVVNAMKINFEGYKLLKVTPRDKSTVQLLEDIRKLGIGELWEDIVRVNQDVKMMVSSQKMTDFLNFVNSTDIEYKVVMEDIQKVIDDQLKSTITRFSQSYLSYSWTEYHNLGRIYAWLDELEQNHPNVVTTVVMGKTLLGNEIKGIIINYNPERDNPQIGVLEGALHAREWISPAAITWIIKEFLTSTDPEVRALAENFEWHIFPLVNPDGYSYTFTNVTVGATDDPCSNLYAGPGPLSELESKAIRDYVLKLKLVGEIIYYVAFHSYTQLIVVPYSHVSSEQSLLSGNYADMYEVAIRGAEALKKRYGTAYKVGLSDNVLYKMSGTSFDWVKHAANVPMTYLIELRDLGEYGFLLPPDQIIPTGLETMDALLEMDRTTRSLGYYSSGVNEVCSTLVVVILSIFSVMFT